MALSGHIVVARRRSTDRKGLVLIVPNLVQKGGSYDGYAAANNEHGPGAKTIMNSVGLTVNVCPTQIRQRKNFFLDTVD